MTINNYADIIFIYDSITETLFYFSEIIYMIEKNYDRRFSNA